jgi:excisionase family DNA binding protein
MIEVFEPLLCPNDAAALLGIHTNTILLWARIGRVPSLHIGRKVAFRASALNRWLDEQIQSQSAVRAA